MSTVGKNMLPLDVKIENARKKYEAQRMRRVVTSRVDVTQRLDFQNEEWTLQGLLCAAYDLVSEFGGEAKVFYSNTYDDYDLKEIVVQTEKLEDDAEYAARMRKVDGHLAAEIKRITEKHEDRDETEARRKKERYEHFLKLKQEFEPNAD